MVDKSEKFSWLVRLGYAARGLVYVLLGYIALSTTGDAAAGGGEAVFDMLQGVPLGTAMLWIMALGLLAYAAFKYLSGISDIQNRGTDTKGALKRVGDVASGVAHTFLAYAAYQFAVGTQQSAGGSQEKAGTVLAYDLGGLVIGLIGLGFLIGAVMQAKDAATGSFMNRISPRAPSGIETVGRIGHAARSVVFAIIGWSLMRSAWFDSESQVKGLGEAILSLRGMGTLYTLVAIGLLLFGVFSLVVSRYRIIPHLSKDGMKPSFR